MNGRQSDIPSTLGSGPTTVQDEFIFCTLMCPKRGGDHIEVESASNFLRGLLERRGEVELLCRRFESFFRFR